MDQIKLLKATFVMTTEEFNEGIAINKYNNQYSVVCVRAVNDAKFVRFCKPEVGKNKFSEHRLPMGTRLADSPLVAASLLEECARKLREAAANDDDPPF